MVEITQLCAFLSSIGTILGLYILLYTTACSSSWVSG